MSDDSDIIRAANIIAEAINDQAAATEHLANAIDGDRGLTEMLGESLGNVMQGGMVSGYRHPPLADSLAAIATALGAGAAYESKTDGKPETIGGALTDIARALGDHAE